MDINQILEEFLLLKEENEKMKEQISLLKLENIHLKQNINKAINRLQKAYRPKKQFHS